MRNKKDDISISNEDKERLVPERIRSGKGTKQVWYTYRNSAIHKAFDASGKDSVILVKILVVLTKIYWEMRKPK